LLRVRSLECQRQAHAPDESYSICNGSNDYNVGIVARATQQIKEKSQQIITNLNRMIRKNKKIKKMSWLTLKMN
jgi:hypothetical protein